MKPIVLVIIGMIDPTPQTAYLLPHVFIRFETAMGDGYGMYGGIGAGGTGDQAITFLAPRVPNESHLSLVFAMRRVDNAQEFGGGA